MRNQATAGDAVTMTVTLLNDHQILLRNCEINQFQDKDNRIRLTQGRNCRGYTTQSNANGDLETK